MATNVVAEVRKLATAALKSGHPLHGVVQPPSKWASAAGFNGSAASPLRAHMARSSGNGCGRQQRYPAMNAETLLETLDLADTFATAKEQRTKDATARKIGTKVRPLIASGARAAKNQARSTERKQSTAKRAPKVKKEAAAA